jgi:hypothetical protein
LTAHHGLFLDEMYCYTVGVRISKKLSKYLHCGVSFNFLVPQCKSIGRYVLTRQSVDQAHNQVPMSRKRSRQDQDQDLQIKTFRSRPSDQDHDQDDQDQDCKVDYKLMYDTAVEDNHRLRRKLKDCATQEELSRQADKNRQLIHQNNALRNQMRAAAANYRAHLDGLEQERDMMSQDVKNLSDNYNELSDMYSAHITKSEEEAKFRKFMINDVVEQLTRLRTNVRRHRAELLLCDILPKEIRKQIMEYCGPTHFRLPCEKFNVKYSVSLKHFLQ